MPDGSTHPTTLMHIAAGAHYRPQPAAIRTLLDTSHAYDAGLCGCDGPTDPTLPGGLRVVFDGRSIPSITLEICDGEICGLGAIEQLHQALTDALGMAKRMSGVA